MSKSYEYEDEHCTGCYDGCSQCADEPNMCAQCGKVIRGSADFETADMLPLCSEECLDAMDEKERS
jgi:hypothetical protein